MSAFLEGIGKVFGKVADQVQGRVERLKNEKQRLENERKILTSKEYSASGSRRVVVIDKRLLEIDAILVNNAHD